METKIEVGFRGPQARDLQNELMERFRREQVEAKKQASAEVSEWQQWIAVVAYGLTIISILRVWLKEHFEKGNHPDILIRTRHGDEIYTKGVSAAEVDRLLSRLGEISKK